MDAIYNKALMSLNFDRENIIRLVKSSTENQQKNLIQIILGIKDLGKLQSDLTLHPWRKDGSKELQFVQYNPLEDEVIYECKKDCSRWFATQDAANQFMETGSCSFMRWEREKTVECQFEAKYIETYESSMSLEQWNNLQ